MKITDRLTADHKSFMKLMLEVDAICLAPVAKRDINRLRRLLALLKDQVTLHAWFEDTYYYPAISKEMAVRTVAPLTPAYIEHLIHEHRTIDGYLNQLESDVASTPPLYSWPQTFALFFHGLKSHMKREEEELFPASEVLLGTARLHALSEEIEKARSAAPPARRLPSSIPS